MKAIERKKASRHANTRGREGERDEAAEASVSAPIAAVFGIAGVF